MTVSYKQELEAAIATALKVKASIESRAKFAHARADQERTSGLHKTYYESARRADGEVNDLDDAIQLLRRELANVPPEADEAS